MIFTAGVEVSDVEEVVAGEVAAGEAGTFDASAADTELDAGGGVARARGGGGGVRGRGGGGVAVAAGRRRLASGAGVGCACGRGRVCGVSVWPGVWSGWIGFGNLCRACKLWHTAKISAGTRQNLSLPCACPLP